MRIPNQTLGIARKRTPAIASPEKVTPALRNIGGGGGIGGIGGGFGLHWPTWCEVNCAIAAAGCNFACGATGPGYLGCLAACSLAEIACLEACGHGVEIG